MSESNDEAPRDLTEAEKAAEAEAQRLNSERGVNYRESESGKDLDSDGDVGVEGAEPGKVQEGDTVRDA